MINFNDFALIEPELTEEEILVYHTVNSFVKDNIKPNIAKWYEESVFPVEFAKKMGDLGLLGSSVPEYGGAGMSSVAYGLIAHELERGDSGFRSFASVQSSLVIFPIYAFGSDKQKEKYLPGLIAGEKIGCFGLTEPDFGSNPGGMKTNAVKKGSKWILNGAKMWITNGSIADIAVVWAKTEDGIRGFIVEKEMEGFSAPLMKHKMSLRASVTSELVFDNVEIPNENVLPKAIGLKYPLYCLSEARFGIGWGALGAAMDCYLEAVNYAKNRIQFDKPIASFQLVQQKLADMLTELTKGQLLALKIGRLKESKNWKPYHISMLKRNNVKIALEIARTAREILGANGISLEYPIIRHMCNLESVNTYEGTYDIHTLILGQHITGIQAFN